MGDGGLGLGRSQGVSLPFSQLQAASLTVVTSLWFHFPLSTLLSVVSALVKQPLLWTLT